MLRVLALIVVVGVVVSGCAGESGIKADATTNPSGGADFTQATTADTGSVKGVVTNEEMQPLEGAQVALLDVPGKTYETRTDAAGAFGFAEVPPGSFRIVVGELGYESVGRKVDVVPGETTEVNVVLVAIAVVTSYHKTEEVAGFVGCSVTIYTAQSAQRAVTWVCGEVALGNNWYPNHKNLHSWKVPKDYMTHIAELDWKANSEAAKQMRILLSTIIDCTPVVCLVATAYNEEKNGERPVKIAFNAEDKKSLGKEFELKARVRSGHPEGSTPAVSAVLDQRYVIYVTNFFGEVAAEDFSAAPPEPL